VTRGLLSERGEPELRSTVPYLNGTANFLSGYAYSSLSRLFGAADALRLIAHLLTAVPAKLYGLRTSVTPWPRFSSRGASRRGLPIENSVGPVVMICAILAADLY
jgi:hypothetical protein